MYPNKLNWTMPLNKNKISLKLWQTISGNNQSQGNKQEHPNLTKSVAETCTLWTHGKQKWPRENKDWGMQTSAHQRVEARLEINPWCTVHVCSCLHVYEQLTSGCAVPKLFQFHQGCVGELIQLQVIRRHEECWHAVHGYLQRHINKEHIWHVSLSWFLMFTHAYWEIPLTAS